MERSIPAVWTGLIWPRAIVSGLKHVHTVRLNAHVLVPFGASKVGTLANHEDLHVLYCRLICVCTCVRRHALFVFGFFYGKMACKALNVVFMFNNTI